MPCAPIVLAEESSSARPLVISTTKFFWHDEGSAAVGLLSIGER